MKSSHSLHLVRAAFLLLFGMASGMLGCGDAEQQESPQSLCMTGSGKAMVMTQMKFARQDTSGISVGFDLDGYTASAGDPKTCGHASLTSPPPGNMPGIDNQLSVLLPSIDAISPSTVDADLQNAISSGMLLFGFELSGVDDLKNDDCVQVAFSHLAGSAAVGTDAIIEANQTFDVDKSLPVVTAAGKITDGYLDAGPFDLELPIKIQDWDFPLAVHGVRVHMAVSDDNALSGMLGGSVNVKEVSDKVTMYGIGDALKELIPVLLHNVADLDLDKDTMTCREFSMAATISAKTAFINH